MKKLISIVCTTLFAAFSAINAQDLKEVIQNHFDAIGQDKVVEARSVVMHGKILQMGMELPIVMYTMKPNNFRMEAEFQGNKMIQAFDGENGWAVIPWTGNTEPQDMGPDEIKQMKQRGDLEGDFYRWQEKGYTVSLEGQEDMEGTPAYKIKVLKPESDETIYYIDSESFMILKTISKTMMQGTEVVSNVSFSNYKMVEGMAMAFTMEMEVNGQSAGQLVFEKVEVNPELDKDIFKKPVKQ